MMLFLQIFLLILTTPSVATSLNHQDYKTLWQPGMGIFYLVPDSAYAREASVILSKAYQEISADLQLTDLETLKVFIAPSRKAFLSLSMGRLPQWSGAFASPGLKTMVIKSPRWDRPQNDFRISLIHELLHLLLHERIAYRPIPRWMDEGLAVFYAESQNWKTFTALSKAAATNSLIPLAEIDQVLEFRKNKAELAYQESYSAVRYLLLTYDIEALRTILQGISNGEELDVIFSRATGSTLRGFEQEWIQYVKKNYKWYWLSEMDSYVWILILVLFVLAWIAIRLRARRTLKSWEESSAPDDPDVNHEDSQ
jgi:hypothetical protein